ncbi:putative EDS1, EP domain-containing protein [Helianthus annuus]|nr:putative EDS1, EP domain-containing protein [Helianthus annuus]
MVRRKDLPDDFEVWGELVDLGTRFRRVYEPLDIANYYRHSKGEDTGSRYMEGDQRGISLHRDGMNMQM